MAPLTPKSIIWLNMPYYNIPPFKTWIDLRSEINPFLRIFYPQIKFYTLFMYISKKLLPT